MVLKTVVSFDCFGLSDQGCVRDMNEDAWTINKEKGTFIIADGMGGRKAGEIASSLAVEYLDSFLNTHNLQEATVDLKKGFEETNHFINKKAKEEEAYSGMGTTLLSLILSNSTAFYAHVGDSRLYLLREKKLFQLTEDHSLVNELIAMGDISAEEAPITGLKHILSKAIGTHTKVEPSIGSYPLKEGDLFLLATDGLTNLLSQKELEEILNKKNSLKKKGEKLVELAKIKGGGDNITLILVRIDNL